VFELAQKAGFILLRITNLSEITNPRIFNESALIFDQTNIRANSLIRDFVQNS